MTPTAGVVFNLQSSLIGGAFGLVIGFILGRIHAKIPAGRLDTVRAVIGVSLIALALLTSVQLWLATAQNRRQAECQGQDRAEYRAGLQARTDAANASSQAEIEYTRADVVWLDAYRAYLDVATDPRTTVDQRVALTARYQRAIEAKRDADLVKIAAQQRVVQVRQDNPATGRLDCDHD